MRIGVPKEIKNNENRVGMTPAGVGTLAAAGHEVRVERGAGLGAGFTDDDYASAGADLVDAATAWGAELVIKVKEPLASEYGYLRGQLVFTYFHLAGVDPSLTEALLASRTTAIAYETVEDAEGRLPLLAPMSAVAGSMAPIMGAYYLAKFNRGRGMLPGEILGTTYGNVVIVGDGVVGRHAARVAAAMGTRVVIFGLHPSREPEIKRINERIEYALSNEQNLSRVLEETDLLVGATLIRGARAPHVVSAAMVGCMPSGSVIVDVSIDQGGCVETSRPTSHADPVFVSRGVTHYCVTNMPGAYPRTSTFALTEATLPYAVRIAAGGLDALAADAGLAKGVNTHAGFVCYRPVADALGRAGDYRDFASSKPA